MNAEKVYNAYWESGIHTCREWNEKEFQRWFGSIAGRDNVLDYGCGLGLAYQRHLVKVSKCYTGADVSSKAVADARSKGLNAVAISQETGVTGLPSNSFDGAVCVEVFEHLFEPLNAAKELHRVLKPGGVLIATVPNFGYIPWRLMALLRAQVPSEPEDKVGNRYHGPHIRFFSKLMLTRLLSHAGFTDIEVGSFGKGSIWDVFAGIGPLASICDFANKKLPESLHLRFLQDVWPNVFAERLRAVARKPNA